MRDDAFADLIAQTPVQRPLRRAITGAKCRPEADVVAELLADATLAPDTLAAARQTGRALIEAVRSNPPTGPQAWVHAYRTDTPAGRALMELAEALPRIPDPATASLLLRDRLVAARWRNGLALGGALDTAKNLALTPFWFAVAPLLRRIVTARLLRLAEAFVLGEDIGTALHRTLPDFRYSFDMLGEAAVTTADAEGYYTAYADAIAATGAASAGRGPLEGPGISVKLSALHPRYERAQRDRVRAELLPRLRALAVAAKAQNIGLTLDAEEAHRLDLSLDLLEALATDPALAGWHGLGLAVQAYTKRVPAVVAYCTGLARHSGHRLMVRLVKGAYWDGEIKRAQMDGVEDFPVFTRKAHTDVAYLACARRMLAAGPVIYPQFATHNALTVASIHTIARPDAEYEFQCLHGMGEVLYGAVQRQLGVRCRVYAPVGPHAALLAYLVRRLLENGANSSFVHRLYDISVPPNALLLDPAAEAKADGGAPHKHLRRPPDLFAPARRNATGFDFASEASLHRLAHDLSAAPPPPAVVPGDVNAAFAAAAAYTPPPPPARTHVLAHAAELLERHRAELLAALVEEGRKTLPAAMAELREAVDYLRYYGTQVERWAPDAHRPLGIVACISPWNFPLAIFLGQVVAAFAAGNAVLAKPAEETPRIAALAMKLLHAAGVPRNGVHLLQGDGTLGAALVADPRVQGVVFTGSTAVGHAIQATLAQRTTQAGKPVPLIAETAGQNAMVVDASALPEQVIADALVSAFDSSGQRCSALRILCLQEEIAPLILPRLKAALAELRAGPASELSTDLPPLISPEAAARVRAHIERLRALGCAVTQGTAPGEGDYVPATVIEIPDLTVLGEEAFGPVLHVLIWRRTGLDLLLDRLNALGFGLTFGLQTRIATRVSHVAARIRAGNIYVNRNMIGAVVGVQPFGGHGLSGTGPKAGGPLYLHRLLARGPAVRPVLGLLPGPEGETNLYELLPRGPVLCLAHTKAGRRAQREAVRAAGCRVVTSHKAAYNAVLLEGGVKDVRRVAGWLASRKGPILPVYVLSVAEIAAGACYNPGLLAYERVITTNTAAIGGNPGLLSII